MAALRTLTVNLVDLNMQTAVIDGSTVEISLERVATADSFAIVPTLSYSKVSGNTGILTFQLLPNDEFTKYRIKVTSASGQQVLDAFFAMPDANSSLAPLLNLSTYPDGFNPPVISGAIQIQVNGEDIGLPTTIDTLNLAGVGITGGQDTSTATINITYSGLFKGNWDMSSGTAPSACVPVSGYQCEFDTYSLSPNSTLTGPGPLYLSACQSLGTISKTGSGQVAAAFIVPTYDPADTVLIQFMALVNSGATDADIEEVINNRTPANPVWMALVDVNLSGPVVVIGAYNNNSLTGYDDGGTVGGALVEMRFNYDTNQLSMIVDGTPYNPAPLDVESIPQGQNLRLITGLGSTSQNTVFAAGVSEFTFWYPDTVPGFVEATNATIPAGALDLDEYEVSVAGYFAGKHCDIGDYVKLIRGKTDIEITRVPTVKTVAGVSPDTSGNIPLGPTDVGADPAGTAAGLNAVSYNAQEPSAADVIQAQRNLLTQFFVGQDFPTGAVSPAGLLEFDSNNGFLDLLVLEQIAGLWNVGASSINGSLSDVDRTATFSSTGANSVQLAKTVTQPNGKWNCSIQLTAGPNADSSLFALFWLNDNGEYAGWFTVMTADNRSGGGYWVTPGGSNGGSATIEASQMVGQTIRLFMDIDTGTWSIEGASQHLGGFSTLTANSPGRFIVEMYNYPSQATKLNGTVLVLDDNVDGYPSI